MAIKDKNVEGMTVGQVASEAAALARLNASLPAVDMAAHQANLARRAAERAKTAHLRDACLNPREASKCELSKERYRYTVTARWMEHNKNGELALSAPYSATVIALNPDDAWAHFCDTIKRYPGRRSCYNATGDRVGPDIVQGEAVSLADFAASQTSLPYRSNQG